MPSPEVSIEAFAESCGTRLLLLTRPLGDFSGGEPIWSELRRRDPALRVLMSLASSTSSGTIFDALLEMPDAALPDFVATLRALMQANDLDGVEIEWTGGSVASLKRILAYVRTHMRDKLIFVALTPEQIGDAELADNVDLLVLRAWHPTRDPGIVETPAPLELATTFVEETIAKGVPPKKIILGIPLFGWSYRLVNLDDGESVYANGYGVDGKYTTAKGQLACFEVIFHRTFLFTYKFYELIHFVT